MRLPIITGWLERRRIVAKVRKLGADCGWVAAALGRIRADTTGRPVPPARARLPNRRMSMRETVAFEFSGKNVREFEITFGFDAQGTIREVFCAGAHTQSDLQGIIHDGCIAASIALQHGANIADLVKSFGELRDEGTADGPPASPLGAIARAGAALEAEMREGAQ